MNEEPKKINRMPIVVAVRGSEAYRDWVDQFAKKNRTPVSQLVDRALAEMAERQNFTPPPER